MTVGSGTPALRKRHPRTPLPQSLPMHALLLRQLPLLCALAAAQGPCTWFFPEESLEFDVSARVCAPVSPPSTPHHGTSTWQ